MIPVEPKLSYRIFYPQVPAIVCAKRGKEVAAMPASSVISVSNSPPLIALAIKRGLRTGMIIAKSGVFSLNWLSFDNRASILTDLAGPSSNKKGAASNTRKRGFDKLAHFGIDYRTTSRVPVLSGASAYLICIVRQVVASGDHDLFIAQVKRARASQDFGPESKYWRFIAYRPILYLGENQLATLP